MQQQRSQTAHSVFAHLLVMPWFNCLESVEVLTAGLVLPRLPKAALPLAVGTVGALIMPHNMYLQSAVVQSRYHTAEPTACSHELLMHVCQCS